MRAMKDPVLTAATNKSFGVDDVMLLHVLLGYLRVKTLFCFVTRLAVPLLLGSSSIYRFVRVLYPHEQKFVPFQSHPVTIVDKL